MSRSNLDPLASLQGNLPRVEEAVSRAEDALSQMRGLSKLGRKGRMAEKELSNALRQRATIQSQIAELYRADGQDSTSDWWQAKANDDDTRSAELSGVEP